MSKLKSTSEVLQMENEYTKFESKAHSTKREQQNVRGGSIPCHIQNVSNGIYKNEAMRLLAFFMALVDNDKDRLYKGSLATRRMLEEYTPFRANQICQHVKTLLDLKLIQESKEKRPCVITGNKVLYLRITPSKSIQKSLFENG